MYSCDPTTRRTGCFATARTPDGRGRAETNGRYFWPQPIFFTANAQLSLFSGKCMRRRRDAARPPPAPAHPRGPRPSPLIKSPDSVKKDSGRGLASEPAAVFQSAYIRRRFQMMTEIKHTLRSGRSVGRTVGRGRLYVGTVENCSFLGPSQPPHRRRLPARPTDDDISNF